MQKLYKTKNYAVDIANDGQIGYEHASTGIYDMIILDLMLPKMNGYEVLSALRRDGDNVSGTYSLRKNRT